MKAIGYTLVRVFFVGTVCALGCGNGDDDDDDAHAAHGGASGSGSGGSTAGGMSGGTHTGGASGSGTGGGGGAGGGGGSEPNGGRNSGGEATGGDDAGGGGGGPPIGCMENALECPSTQPDTMSACAQSMAEMGVFCAYATCTTACVCNATGSSSTFAWLCFPIGE